MSRESDFISETRQAAKDLMRVLNRIGELNREYQGRGGTSWLQVGDFVGSNAEITKAEFDTAFGNMAAMNTETATNNRDDTIYLIV